MLQNVADLLSGPDLSRVTDAALHGFAQEYASSLTDRESLAYKLFGSVSGGSWTPWASHSASEATANSTAPSR